MGSYGGHVLPGSFFLLFGFWYTLKFSYAYLRTKLSGKNAVLYCCKNIPFNGLVIEGVVKIVMVSIGILIEMFYPGAPMGHLVDDNGNFFDAANWQHATMYFWFGVSGLADIITFTARRVVPAGFERLVAGIALFIEGYLFYFHLHGRSHLNIRVHILLVLAVWPSALFAFLQCILYKKRFIRHIFEMLTAILVLVQGAWFWQAAYILYPPHGKSWDPCSEMPHEEMRHSMTDDDCNYHPQANNNIMFMTMFWTWHVGAATFFVFIVYLLVYRYLKCTGQLDERFLRDYELLNGDIHPQALASKSLLVHGDEEDEV